MPLPTTADSVETDPEVARSRGKPLPSVSPIDPGVDPPSGLPPPLFAGVRIHETNTVKTRSFHGVDHFDDLPVF